MPSTLKHSILEDAVLDYALSELLINAEVESLQDAISAMDDILRSIFVNAGLLIASGVSKRLGYKAFLSLKGSAIDVERLSKRLHRVVLDDNTETNKNLVLVNVGGKRLVTVRVPDVDKENLGQIDNLGLVLDAIKTCLNIGSEDIKIVYDQTLGRDFFLPAPIQRTLTGMIGSCHSKDGSFSGSIFEFKTKLKGNLVEILAAIKLLKDRSGKLRNMPGTRDEKGRILARPTLNLEDLKSKFNENSGLKAPGVPAYVTGLVTGLLSELVKTTNPSFPGVWIHSLKSRNGVKSSDGIIAMMGYKPIVATPHKILKVFLSKTSKSGNKDIIAPYDTTKSDKENSPDYREFRAAVSLTLPLLDTKSNMTRKNLAIDPLSVTNKNTIDHYKSIVSNVDALDLCFSIATAVSNPSNKIATPAHFANAKGALVSSFSETKGFIDSNGIIFDRYLDIPEHCRKFLEKTFNKKIVVVKRPVPDEAEDEMMVEGNIPKPVAGEASSSASVAPLRPTRAKRSAKKLRT
jgi:hypothetical protein